MKELTIKKETLDVVRQMVTDGQVSQEIAEESLGINSETYNEIVDECIYGEQKPTWSKEDDVRLQACIDALQAKSICGKVDTIMTKWLKSLKQRIGG